MLRLSKKLTRIASGRLPMTSTAGSLFDADKGSRLNAC